MKTLSITLGLVVLTSAVIFTRCGSPEAKETTEQPAAQTSYGGYETREKWGEHLVLTSLCHDCHTPKKMTDHGPDFDMDRMLSGHPAAIPPPEIDRKEVESKGLVVTNTLTAWVGPWGISYSANLTSDVTGIGNWQESAFMNAIRHGKFKGIDSARPLLPPMPWEMLKNMTDDELKAIFAYLKSTPPIQNVVPEPQPPVLATASK
jgi:hypothetical protein